MNTDTPRTDHVLRTTFGSEFNEYAQAFLPLCRQLERDLAAAQDEIAQLGREQYAAERELDAARLELGFLRQQGTKWW